MAKIAILLYFFIAFTLSFRIGQPELVMILIPIWAWLFNWAEEIED